MPKQQTIRINQGYRIDSSWELLALVGRGVRRLSALLWRWRTELGVGLAVVAVRLLAGRLLSPSPALVVTALLAAAALAWPPSRALITGRLGCARSRRRILACLRETRVATSTGRLPLVLRSRVTAAGERLTLALFPGQSAELLDARVEELRAAARARDVTVTRDPARADRVTVEVIRRDLLNPGVLLPSPLVDLAAVLGPAPLVPDPSTAAPATPLRPLLRRFRHEPVRSAPAPTPRRPPGAHRSAVTVRPDLPRPGPLRRPGAHDARLQQPPRRRRPRRREVERGGADHRPRGAVPGCADVVPRRQTRRTRPVPTARAAVRRPHPPGRDRPADRAVPAAG